MAKNANVSVRVEPEIKEQAEAYMSQLGLPVSVVINALYRQIIRTKGIPFPLSLNPSLPVRSKMTDEEFNEMMTESLAQAESGRGEEMETVFERLEKRCEEIQS